MIENKLMVLSSIYGVTSKDKEITYKFKVKYTDFYCIKYSGVNVEITCKKNKIDLAKRKLKANEIVYIKVSSNKENQEFYLDIYPINKKGFEPFKIKALKPSFNEIGKPSEVKYSKRKGGSYIYSNVPESMPDEVLNSITMKNKNLKGDVFVTIEHQNKTNTPEVYLGYYLENEGNEDAYVTLLNCGYQVEGSWLGEKSWTDYYGIKYSMSTKSFKGKDKKWAHDYINFDNEYQPSPIKQTTYRIPPHERLFVLGGRKEDNLNNIEIPGSTNKPIRKNCCANGNVFFNVAKGKITGNLVAYDGKRNDFENFKVQNFRRYGENDDLGGRLGISKHQGVIESTISFAFNDSIKGNLPVYYNSKYSDTLKDSYKPLEPIENITSHRVEDNVWKTHLSSQLHHDYIGSDMVENEVIYKGKKIKLSTDIANPAGRIWDFGNWMIEYQDNMYFKNDGNKKRTICLYILNGGSLLYIVKSKQNKVLKAGATYLHCTGQKPAYKFNIKPHSTKFVSLQYVLCANNNGSIEHKVTVE